MFYSIAGYEEITSIDILYNVRLQNVNTTCGG